MKLQQSIKRYLKTVLLGAVVLLLSSCMASLNVTEPVDLLWDKSGKKTDRLIVFLPGLYDVAERFQEESFFTIARNAGIKADMVAASIHVGHFLQKKLVKRIDTDIFEKIKNEGYKNIWFVGVSLGGLNTLLYKQQSTKNICGMVLLAPYLGSNELVKEIQDVGGVKYWTSDSKMVRDEIDQQIAPLWLWLKAYAPLSKIYIGYGKEDRYAAGHQLLENMLEEKNVVVVAGKHNWEVGRIIWREQLLTRERTGLLQPCH